jgi:bifunctional DNA-binding transcriptional regulator/antitoxin component of YhaV-PrlF toxin-antitoxin module
MTVSTVVGTKGQVTIERGIRQELGVKPGWRAIQRRVGHQVVITFRPPRHRRSLLGILSNPRAPRLETDLAFQKAVEQAWDEAAAEAYGHELQSAPAQERIA